MKCPVCSDAVLIEHELEPALSSHSCAQCGGNWVMLDRYLGWLDSVSDPPQHAPAEEPVTCHDIARAKICPTCGHLLRRASVGHGLTFGLDRCGHCGGFWFDRGEWEALKAEGLHRQAHFVFSDTWQAEIARREREKQHERALIEKLGPDDYAHVQRISVWIRAHPHRAELVAILLASAVGGATKHGELNPPLGVEMSSSLR